MSIIEIKSKEEFKKIIGSNELAVILFATEWAEQCGQVIDVMTELSKQTNLKNVQFASVSAEEFSDISNNYKIEAVPTVLFMKSKTVIGRIVGIDIAKLTLLCSQLSNESTSTSSNNLKSGQNLDARLKDLINKSTVMIFMKGNRNTPKCGFSKQLISIFNETEVNYETFDILTDEEVRQGLKTYSDWPTYPQVYVKGELIGGLDIIKELLKNDELISVLNG